MNLVIKEWQLKVDIAKTKSWNKEYLVHQKPWFTTCYIIKIILYLEIQWTKKKKHIHQLYI